MSTVLQVNDVTKRYGPLAVLDRARVSFAPDKKVGVIGRNGAGKSTLVRIIVGDEEPDEGDVMRHPSLRLGYLEQHAPYREDETAMAFLRRYAEKEEWQCAKAASRFEMRPEMLEKRVGELSEGYRMRVRLTGMLLKEPNFLVLDEPTNYLDLRTQMLLEEFLRTFRGGFLVVSHDREFLKNTCEETLEVDRGRLFLYPQGIEEYLAYKEQRAEEIERENRKIDARKRHLQTFVDRFRFKASKASQAQSKLKQIAKLTRIEIEHPIAAARIRIPAPKIKKGIAVKCSALSIGYPGRTVAEGVTLDLERGRHYAVLGDNGQGKTTFLKTLAGIIPPVAGEYRWGADLKVAYYGEHVFRSLDAHDKIGAYLLRHAAPGVTTEEVFQMAGNFLFSQDDFPTLIGTLSGGERSRLCLAGLLLTGSTVFLLDEPTNHLDFETVEALGLALREYPGTILFVSHNRTFVNLIATAIVEVGEGRVRGFAGTYEEYVWALSEEVARVQPAGEKREKRKEKSEKTEEARPKREVHEELKEQKKKLKKIEARVAEYEDEKTSVLARMALNPTVFSPTLSKRLHELGELIAADEEEWFRVRQAIEWLEKE
ncbi:MAG TPA: ABC-F family ATP-binding cassette domain-containing protein [Candidatus Eisenbacteria bacterium]|nr:ABC-F family ATP-binding cassette domain-containing protein [Candidatus Eisenbacteria bacterium]